MRYLSCIVSRLGRLRAYVLAAFCCFVDFPADDRDSSVALPGGKCEPRNGKISANRDSAGGSFWRRADPTAERLPEYTCLQSGSPQRADEACALVPGAI